MIIFDSASFGLALDIDLAKRPTKGVSLGELTMARGEGRARGRGGNTFLHTDLLSLLRTCRLFPRRCAFTYNLHFVQPFD